MYNVLQLEHRKKFKIAKISRKSRDNCQIGPYFLSLILYSQRETPQFSIPNLGNSCYSTAFIFFRLKAFIFFHFDCSSLFSRNSAKCKILLCHFPCKFLWKDFFPPFLRVNCNFIVFTRLKKEVFKIRIIFMLAA